MTTKILEKSPYFYYSTQKFQWGSADLHGTTILKNPAVESRVRPGFVAYAKVKDVSQIRKAKLDKEKVYFFCYFQSPLNSSGVFVFKCIHIL